uniref:Uncharacterized protein n=1 Tax=Panagrellus redivivus TaxID=6233 RepID=A0A7E4VKN5_PANRE
MQTRALFALLILCLTVGIAFTLDGDDYNFVPLEERSVEELARFYFANSEASMTELHGKELIDEKVRLANTVVNHPELLGKIDLPVDQYCDLVLQTLLNDYKKLTPSQLAEEKKYWIDTIKEDSE